MLERTCQQILSGHLEKFALRILGPDCGFFRSRYLFAKTRETETTLFPRLCSFALDDLRIDQHQLLFRVFSIGRVDNRNALRYAYLRSGQADALRRIHGLE